MTTHSTELTVGRPRRGSIGTILETLVSLVERRRLVWSLTISEIRNKGTNSLLGNIWWFLDPALQLFIYFLLTSVIFQQNRPAALLFLGSAIIPWKWFSAALASATTSVRSREQVMRQIAFPHIVLPASSVFASVANFLFALVPFGVYASGSISLRHCLRWINSRHLAISTHGSAFSSTSTHLLGFSRATVMRSITAVHLSGCRSESLRLPLFPRSCYRSTSSVASRHSL